MTADFFDDVAANTTNFILCGSMKDDDKTQLQLQNRAPQRHSNRRLEVEFGERRADRPYKNVEEDNSKCSPFSPSSSDEESAVEPHYNTADSLHLAHLELTLSWQSFELASLRSALDVQINERIRTVQKCELAEEESCRLRRENDFLRAKLEEIECSQVIDSSVGKESMGRRGGKGLVGSVTKKLFKRGSGTDSTISTLGSNRTFDCSLSSIGERQQMQHSFSSLEKEEHIGAMCDFNKQMTNSTEGTDTLASPEMTDSQPMQASFDQVNVIQRETVSVAQQSASGGLSGIFKNLFLRASDLTCQTATTSKEEEVVKDSGTQNSVLFNKEEEEQKAASSYATFPELDYRNGTPSPTTAATSAGSSEKQISWLKSVLQLVVHQRQPQEEEGSDDGGGSKTGSVLSSSSSVTIPAGSPPVVHVLRAA